VNYEIVARKKIKKSLRRFYFYLREIVIRCWKRKSDRRSEAHESGKPTASLPIGFYRKSC